MIDLLGVFDNTVDIVAMNFAFIVQQQDSLLRTKEMKNCEHSVLQLPIFSIAIVPNVRIPATTPLNGLATKVLECHLIKIRNLEGAIPSIM